MKTSLTALALFMALTCTSQIKDWYGVDLSRFGYKRSSIKFENRPVDEFYNYPLSTGNFGVTEARGASFELSVDLYKKHFYFNLDGSSFLDIGATLFQFDDSKQRWWDNDEYQVLRSDILPIRMAFGSNIGKYVNVYAGGQWALTAYGLTYKENSQPFENTRVGGSTYGFGGHVVVGYKFLNFRYSYMKNWMSQAQLFKGNSITNEAVLSLGGADAGVFLKLTHVYATSDAGFLPIDRTELFNNEYDNAEYAWQSSQHVTQFQGSIGIYAAGLFSGISKAGSTVISETERGVAKQRREERRRKIEWKE